MESTCLEFSDSSVLAALGTITASCLPALASETKDLTSSTDIAKFKPSLPGEPKELIPINFPLSLNNGPPELPGLLGVWVWITSASNSISAL